MSEEVYTITYYDSTAGPGVNGTYRDKTKAIDVAWKSARECTRDWAKEAGYPREVPCRGNEILNIEYGMEDWIKITAEELQ